MTTERPTSTIYLLWWLLVVGLIAVGVLFIAAQVYVFGIDNLWYAMKNAADPENVFISLSIRPGRREAATIRSPGRPAQAGSSAS
jgi:hypothetical protein